MSGSWLGGEKYQFLSHWFDSTRVRTHGFESHDLPKWETDVQSGNKSVFLPQDKNRRCILCYRKTIFRFLLLEGTKRPATIYKDLLLSNFVFAISLSVSSNILEGLE